MKHCPKCNRTYADDAQNFCLDDGTPLVAKSDPQATYRSTAAPTLPVGRVPEQFIETPANRKGFGPLALVLIFGAGIIVCGIVVAAVIYGPRVNSLFASSNRVEPSGSPSASPSASPSDSPTEKRSPTPKSSPTPAISPPPAPSPKEPTGSIPGRFPEASQTILSQNYLRGQSCFDLKIMRNEIFARHGYIFKTPDMVSYFNGQSWYRARYADVTPMLSDIEKKNAQSIREAESASGCS
jgi:hypothetical protein